MPRHHVKPVSLPAPPFEWLTHGRNIALTERLPDGTRRRVVSPAPLARRPVTEEDLEIGPEVGADGLLVEGANGDLVMRRARVWRTALPLALKLLPPAGRAAMLDYAHAFEAVGASGGTADPTGGGGAAPGSRSPSLARLLAAERLRAMDKVLADGVVTFLTPATRRHLRRRPAGTLPYRDLVIWAVVDGLTRPQMLARAGVGGEAATEALTLGLVDAAARLAICCGYGPAPSRERRAIRNGSSPKI